MSTIPDDLEQSLAPAPDETAPAELSAELQVDLAPPETFGSEITPQEVGHLVSTLVKALRAHQIYQANNPVYQRFVGGIRDLVTGVWARTNALHFTVSEHSLVWEGHSFTTGDTRESLAYAFYKDGIRMFSFLPGFEEEVGRFLEVIHASRNVGKDQEDLVSLLWEQEFAAFQYSFVDMLSDGLVLPENTGNVLEPVSSAQVREDSRPATERPDQPPSAASAAEAEPEPIARSITRDDFDETLYFLDEHELHALQQEVDREWARDLKTDVLNALFDRLEDAHSERQTEILRILRQLLAVSLSHGEIRVAATILRELDAFATRSGALGEAQLTVVNRLFEELSDPEVLGQLVALLEGGQIAPEAEELSLFFRHLRPKALPVLVRAAETTVVGGVQERLISAVDGLLGHSPEAVKDLLADSDPILARGAARLVGRLKIASAAPAVVTLLKRSDASVRLAAVEALANMPTGATMEGLLQAIDDADRDVRVAAVRAIGALKYRPARARLEAAIQGRLTKEADLTERIAYFETYGVVGGPEAVPLMDKFLNGRGLLGRRQPPEVRACAALALGRVASPAAKTALNKAADEQDMVVRSAVNRALRQEAPQA